MNESAHWGLQGVGQPLTRLANQATQRSNRTKICGASVFTADPTLNTALVPYDDQDSCDEFPFAATYQSGAQTGVTSGTACAQLTVVQTGTTNNQDNEAADWAGVTPTGTPTLTENCVPGTSRSPSTRKRGVHTIRFIQANRLLISGKFWVAVTA